LEHRRSDPDLASVRDPQALERLPENERDAWQALWLDVRPEPTTADEGPRERICGRLLRLLETVQANYFTGDEDDTAELSDVDDVPFPAA
jgi:hypothetical protein